MPGGGALALTITYGERPAFCVIPVDGVRGCASGRRGIERVTLVSLVSFLVPRVAASAYELLLLRIEGSS